MLYDIGFAMFSLFYLPTLIFKGKLHGDFRERFGVYDKAKREALAGGKNAIWIQAVSVGEVALCRSLIPSLKERFPDSPIVLSTITRTGNDLAKKLFAGQATVIYFPLDFSSVVKKVTALIRPAIYIMIETEIWPNLLKEMARGNIPAVLINGRISDRSIGKYELVKNFLKPALESIGLFCMQSEADRERVKSLGAPAERIKVTGNMKFDVDIKADIKTMETLRESLSMEADEGLFVAGSTHRGEEEIIISVYKELIRDFPDLKLLIAPRHIERSGKIGQMIKKHGFIPVRLSTLNEQRTANNEQRIFILDTIGRLKEAYAVSAIVFIGGSLIKHGGQNPIEPAMFGKPILFGPYMFNFKGIAKAFLDNSAAIQVSGEQDLFLQAGILLRDRTKRERLGINARKVVLDNRGATEKNIEAIKSLIAPRHGAA